MGDKGGGGRGSRKEGEGHTTFKYLTVIINLELVSANVRFTVTAQGVTITVPE